MIADFFIKPLQGKRFMKLRDMILNISSEFEDLGTSLEHRSMLDNSMKNAEVLRHLSFNRGTRCEKSRS